MKAGDLIECDAGLYDEGGDYLGAALGAAIIIDTHASLCGSDQYIEVLYDGMQAFIVQEGVVRILNEK